ncbi:MAG: hypothetical protein ABIH37_05155, partial [archaeon]
KLEDVRGEFSKVPNKVFTSKIWENATVGEYNLIIDCNSDGNYNNGEPIDQGFSVIFRRGSGNVELGAKNPKDFSWSYDPEAEESNVVILQLKLIAEEESIKLNNVSVEFTFPGVQKVEKLEVYADEDNNGKLDSEESLIGSIEPGVLREEFFSLDYTLEAGVAKNLLFVYKMDENSEKGEYKLKVTKVYGTGVISEKQISFFGLSVNSNILTVLDKKTCLGFLNLNFNPNPALNNSLVNVGVNNLTGCDDKMILLKKDPCYLFNKPEIDSCRVVKGGCGFEINAVGGNYFACIDKDNDGIFIDYGESVSKELLIKGEEASEEENEVIIGIEESGKSETGITGEVISEEGTDKGFSIFQGSSSFLILLEITLVLILIVLILIFVRLKGSRKIIDSAVEEEPSEVDRLIDEREEEKKEEKRDRRKRKTSEEKED